MMMTTRVRRLGTTDTTSSLRTTMDDDASPVDSDLAEEPDLRIEDFVGEF